MPTQASPPNLTDVLEGSGTDRLGGGFAESGVKESGYVLFKTESCYVDQAGLDSQSSRLYLPSTELIGMCPHA